MTRHPGFDVDGAWCGSPARMSFQGERLIGHVSNDDEDRADECHDSLEFAGGV